MFNWLYTAVSWVLLRWHELLTFFGLDAGSGVNWALSIILLVATARLLLFRLFVKQVKYQRHMQKLQPKMKQLREKYKNDKQEMQRQLMKLQQEEGFNPVAGCLPIFLQLPVFWGLYHVLRHLANSASAARQFMSDPSLLSATQNRQLGLYGFSHQQAADAATSKLFGGPLAARLFDSDSQIHTLGGTVTATHTVIIVLVLFSACATFTTQLLVRRSQVTKPEGTAALIQRLMLFGIPAGTLISGTFFPLGVLLYWFGNNNWTMLQQLYINKFHPQEDPSSAPVGELGKTLAPKPGQRPVRPPRGKPHASTQTVEPEAEDTPAAAPPPRSSTPRPGQRPNRPAGKRPPAKRPSKSKKRR